MLTLVAACAGQPKETYPYGMNEKEWNELSIKDKANIRREFYFYEKGSTAFINPQMEVEGKKQEMPLIMQQPKKLFRAQNSQCFDSKRPFLDERAFFMPENLSIVH